MRGPIGIFLVAVAVTACGSSNGGSGDRNPSQATLRLTTSGSGLVRGAGADCRGNCSAQYVSGSQVHLVAVPDPGAVFVGWAGACSGTGGCDLTLDADRDVSATFAAATPPPRGQYRLTVWVQGKGRVTSSPAGIDCETSSCSADFASGTTVTLTPAPASGYGFAGWGTDCSGAGGCTLSVSKDATVYANFVAQAPPPPALVHLTAAVSGPGTVTGAGLDCGESTTKCDVTVPGGSTVTLTASAGGGTRFTGWGGACSGASSTCKLTLQSDTKVTAEFQSEVLALAPNDGTNGTTIALNSTHLFWSRYTGSGSSGIWAVPKKGGDAVRVATGYAYAMVADDAYLYWTDTSNLYSTPVGGGQVALLFSANYIGKLALDETGALYWTVSANSGANSGSVHRMQDRADTVLAKEQNPQGAVAVDANHLYFTDYGSDGGSIRRVPRQGGALERVLYCGTGCYPQAVRLDAQNVYYRLAYSGSASTNAHVQVMSKTDFKVRDLSSGNGTGGSYSLDLDVNASVAYWNWTGGTAPYGIFRGNADGTEFHAVDTSNDSSWLALRVDDLAVYYWHSGAVIRRLK